MVAVKGAAWYWKEKESWGLCYGVGPSTSSNGAERKSLISLGWDGEDKGRRAVTGTELDLGAHYVPRLTLRDTCFYALNDLRYL